MKEDKLRMELRVPRELVEHVDQAASMVGLSRSAFFAIAVSLLAAETSQVFLMGAQRKHLFERLEERILARLEKARQGL